MLDSSTVGRGDSGVRGEDQLVARTRVREKEVVIVPKGTALGGFFKIRSFVRWEEPISQGGRILGQPKPYTNGEGGAVVLNFNSKTPHVR